ncbi:hypothetical protein ABPG72_003549 [Tetrahymena utriculariae]
MINKNQSTSSDLSNDKFSKEAAEYKQQEKASCTNNSIQKNLLEDDFVNQKEDEYRKQKRYYFLPFACFILIGGFFNNTFQAFIKQQFMDSMGIDSAGYNLFVLIPPLPNIILPVFSGHIFNWLNLRRGLFLFSSMVLIGMTLCLIASYPKSLPLMIVGKTIHQIGNEMLCIGQSALVSIWFDSTTISFAFTWGSFVSKLSGSVAGIVFPQLYNIEDDLQIPLFVSVGTCVFSFLCVLVVIYFDYQAEKLYHADKKKGGLTFKQLKEFSGLFWIYVSQAALLYGTFYAFESYLHAILQHKFGIDKTTAGSMVSIPFWVSFSAPVFGIIADKFGKRIFCLIATALVALISIIVILIMPNSTAEAVVYIPLVAFGMFLSMMAAYLFPVYPLLCKLEVIKGAFGIGYASKNAGLSLFGYVGGQILGSDEENYSAYLFFFIGIFSVSIIVSIYGFMLDKKAGGNINSKRPQVSNVAEEISKRMSLGGSMIQ